MSFESPAQGMTPASGGAPSTPSGQASQTGQPSSFGQTSPGGAPASPSAPSVLDISDDSMVRLPGAKDPVKYSDWYRRFQSEFTKRSQQASQLQQQLEQSQRTIAERDAAIQRFQRPQGPQADPNGELINQIKSLSYLKGEDAVGMINHINGQIQQRDQQNQQAVLAIALMYKQMQAMESRLGELHDRSSQGDFSGKMTNYVKSMGLPEEAVDLATEIYLAYTGDDLDQEFPTILRNRWEQIQNLVRLSDRKRAQEARQQTFVPGRGGQGSPSKPLSMAGKSAAERADILWESLQGSDT